MKTFDCFSGCLKSQSNVLPEPVSTFTRSLSLTRFLRTDKCVDGNSINSKSITKIEVNHKLKRLTPEKYEAASERPSQSEMKASRKYKI